MQPLNRARFRTLITALLSVVLLSEFLYIPVSASVSKQVFDMTEALSAITSYLPNGYTSSFSHITGWRLTHEATKAKFGKDSDDVSFRIWSDSMKESFTSYIENKVVTNMTFESGDTLLYGFKCAYGVIRNGAPQLSVYGVNCTNNNEFIKIASDGTVTFNKGEHGKIPDFRENRWYDIRVVINIGSINYASLYIDGVPYAENTIISTSGPITSFSKFRLYYNNMSAMQIGDKIDAFVDDIAVCRYQGANSESQVAGISSASGRITDDGAFVGVSRGMTVGEVVSDISAGGFEARLLKSDFSSYSSDEQFVEDGYLVLTKEEREIFRDLRLQNGMELSDFTYSVSSSGVDVSAEAINRNNQSSYLRLTLARYTSDGTKLLGVSTSKSADADIGETGKCKASIKIQSQSDEVYAYVWDSRCVPSITKRKLDLNYTKLNFSSMLETDADAIAILSDDVAFCASSGVSYYDRTGHKENSSEVFLKNDVLMVSADVIAEAFDLSVSYPSAGNVLINGTYSFSSGQHSTALGTAPVLSDGRVCLPVKAFCRNVLGKYVYEDVRGFAIISDTSKTYSDDMSTNTDNTDIIARYLHFDRPDGDEIYKAVKAVSAGRHPSMVASDEEFRRVKELIKTDDEYTGYLKSLLIKCENYLARPVTNRVMDDATRLYGCISTAANIAYDCALGYSLSGDRRYAERSWKELENLMNWSDWNVKKHFLDSGAAAPRITMAYDMIYDYLSVQQHEIFKKGLCNQYIDYSVGVYNGTSVMTALDYRLTDSNWGAVCSAGMLSAALCLMTEEDEHSELTQKCKYLAEQVLRGAEYPALGLYPSGASDEGIVYWEYYVTNLCRITDLLRNKCGSDYGIFTAPGFDKCTSFALYAQTPNGVYPYSENPWDMGIYYPQSVFHYAKLADDMKLASTLYNFRNDIGASGDINLAFYYDKSENGIGAYPTDGYFPRIELVSMRESWQKSDGVYLGAVGGVNESITTHFDKGSFIYEALGERWFVDLGKDNYNISDDYWNQSTRNKLYRLRAEGHNCMVFNSSAGHFGQEVGERADVVRFESGTDGAIAVYDLTNVYKNQVSSYKRGFKLSENRQSVVIQDEFTLKNYLNSIYWFAHTCADITISSDGKSATLIQNGKSIRAELITNLSSAKFKVMDANPISSSTKVDGEYSREGFRKLSVSASPWRGSYYISVKITPTDHGYASSAHSYAGIDSWSVR